MRKADITKQDNGLCTVRLYSQGGKLIGTWRQLDPDSANAMAHNWGVSGRVSREWPGNYAPSGVFVSHIPTEEIKA